MRPFKIALHALLLLTLLVQLGCGSGGTSSGGGPSPAEAAQTCLGSPLALAKQGSFFVNATTRQTQFPSSDGAPLNPAETISVRGMYVQYQIPQAIKPGASPVILVHGANHTGKTYEETPDGRMGWAEYLVRCGIPVYVVDNSGRARSGFDPSPSNQAKVLGSPPFVIPNFAKFTNEQAWTLFRFGPTLPNPHTNPATQFPVQAADQYFAQLVPDTETSYTSPPVGGQNTMAALAALLDKIGPAVVLTHSQSGQYGIDAAILKPALVKALVSVEPASCTASPPQNMLPVFTQIPLLTIFGDFFGDNPPTEWPGHMTECETTVAAINTAGGIAKNIHLPAPPLGITGNSHMLMMDLNNQQIADIILAWVAKPAR